MVPLGDVGQHTLPCSVIGQCRVSRADGHQNSTPGVGEGWGRSHLSGSERGGGHTPSSVVRWATSQLTPTWGEARQWVSVKAPARGRARHWQ